MRRNSKANSRKTKEVAKFKYAERQIDKWVKIRELGSGGQGTVSLVQNIDFLIPSIRPMNIVIGDTIHQLAASSPSIDESVKRVRKLIDDINAFNNSYAAIKELNHDNINEQSIARTSTHGELPHPLLARHRRPARPV